jgi:acetoacetyl-CoA synthetase
MYPPPRFFPEIRMNVAENIFANYRAGAVILHVASEGSPDVRDVTWDELHADVTRAASAMVSHGVRAGDRVAAVLSNRLEAVVCCLAALSLGALWSSSSPDMGVDGILSRLTQIRPKLVFCEREVVYNGRRVQLLARHRKWAEMLAQETQELEAVVILGGLQPEDRAVPDGTKSIPGPSRLQGKFISWNIFLGRAAGNRQLKFEQLPFSHPGFIVYSSGTTGPPKCIVHTAGGLLMSASKDAFLSYDVHRGDTLLQYTTTAWVMWALVLVSLSFGGKVVLYDGSPMVPDPLVLLRLVDKLRVNVLGTSAKFLSMLRDQRISPRERLDLSSLRTVVSTGSTLTADVAEWFYDSGFPRHVFLNSTCGGSDLACSLISGAASMPMYAGEIQAPSLGMAVDLYDIDDERGMSVQETGAPGEMICKQPWPSEPGLFWDDPSGEKYKNSYFTKYSARLYVRQHRGHGQLEERLIWSQGDFVSRNPVTGGFVTHGRSDGVLNPGGVRFGSAEIYYVVEKDPAVADSVCVGQRRDGDADESVILFVMMTEGHKFTRAVARRLRDAIRSKLSPRHVPKYVFQTQDIPYTVNGKKVEVLVKKVVSGKEVKISPTIANPTSVEGFRQFVRVEHADERQEREWNGSASRL